MFLYLTDTLYHFHSIITFLYYDRLNKNLSLIGNISRKCVHRGEDFSFKTPWEYTFCNCVIPGFPVFNSVSILTYPISTFHQNYNFKTFF